MDQGIKHRPSWKAVPLQLIKIYTTEIIGNSQAQNISIMLITIGK